MKTIRYLGIFSSVAGSLLGLFFKFKQLSLLDPKILSFYPKFWWVESALIGALTLSCFSVLLFLFLKEVKKGLSLHLWAFCVIVLSQYFFNDFLSPRNWDNPLASLHKVESFTLSDVAPTHLGHYQNAKRYDFSNFSPLLWSGMPRGSMNHDCYPLAVLSLIFDLPSASTETYHLMLLILFFGLSCLGSFGFYLFLKEEGFSFVPSLVGGILFVLSNRFFAVKLTENFPAFVAPFLFIPFVLWMLSKAEKYACYRYFFAAGAIFSLQFYVFSSHSDAILHSAIFVFAYLLKTVFFVSGDLKRRIFSFFLFGVSAFICGLYFLAPIIFVNVFRESFQWPHQEGYIFYYGFLLGIKTVLYPLIKAFGLFFLLGLSLGPSFFKGQSKTFCFFVFMIVLQVVFFVPGTEGLLAWLITKLKIKTFHFFRIERVLMYLSFSCLFIAVAITERLIQASSSSRNPLMAVLTLLGACVLIFTKLHPFSEFYIGALFLFTVMALSAKKNNGSSVMAVALAVCITFTCVQEATLEFKSLKLLGNPKNCKPYVSLQSVLVGTRSLPEDKPANLRNLRQRLGQFEKEIRGDGLPLPVLYQSALSELSLSSALQLNENAVEKFTDKVKYDVDDFYFHHFSCEDMVTKKATSEIWSKTYYDLVSILENIPDRFSLIRGITGGEEIYGIGDGYPVIDNTFAIDIRFATAYLPINALYVLPHYYYKSVGLFRDVRAKKLTPSLFKDPTVRKRLNIAGIGVFLFKKADWESFPKDQKEDFQALDFKTTNEETRNFVAVRDLRSYGTLYIAKTTRYIPPLSDVLKKFRFPFVQSDPNQYAEYKKNVIALEKELEALKGEREILIESEEKKGIFHSEGSVKMTNWIGPRMSSELLCESSSCHVVFNQAAVKGWHAFSGEKPLPLLKANMAFLAVSTPQGKHSLWFEWHPLYLSFSLFITLMGYLALIVVFVYSDLGSVAGSASSSSPPSKQLTG